jgi:hypothetical protein
MDYLNYTNTGHNISSINFGFSCRQSWQELNPQGRGSMLMQILLEI